MNSTSASLLGRLRDLGNTQAWQKFEAHYRPRLLAWCREQGLQDADAWDVVQDVLQRVARRMPSFDYQPGRNFSGWLRTVWQHAYLDLVQDRGRGVAGGSGDSAVYDLLRNIPGEDLTRALSQEIEREVLHEALARVQPIVSTRDWDIFTAIVIEGKPSDEVATRHAMTRAAAGMVKVRVQRQVRAEAARLSGEADAE